MSTKNLGVMMAAMMLTRSIDQEDPAMLLKARVGFGVYVIVTSLIYFVLHLRIIRGNDRTKLRVTDPAPPFGPGSDAPPKERDTTHLEYDLDLLQSARKGWIMNTVLLTVIHYKMQTVSPLVMSGFMGFFRLVTDDALFKLHVMGHPAVDKLKRPFPVEENPLAAMMKSMAQKPDEEESTQGEDLHDDGESEEEDEVTPPGIAELTDDHVKGDFEEDAEPKKDK